MSLLTSAPRDLAGYKAFLSRHMAAHSDLGMEILRHEMGASMNRNRLTGQAESLNAFNTDQITWLVLNTGDLPNEHIFISGLILSALIDGRMEWWRAAREHGVVPSGWTWPNWADGFSGTAHELLDRIAEITDWRERAGAACLASAGNPGAIGARLLSGFCRPQMATVYLALLDRALSGPEAARIADDALTDLAREREVLFAGDVDRVLARLIAASRAPRLNLGILGEAMGDFAHVALARHHLDHGRPGEALRLAESIRLLSEVHPQAMLVAALAALEAGDLAKTDQLLPRIEDETTRLKVTVRLANARQDLGAKLDALISLREREPSDAETFVQLCQILDRLGQNDVLRGLCLEGQETFADDPLAGAMIRRVLTESL